MQPAVFQHAGLPDRIEPEAVDRVSPCLDIAFDERSGSVRVYDPRLFQAGRRRFCERLLEAVARQPAIHKAEIDFASSSCQIEFSPGSNAPRSMADAFVRAVREASASLSWLDRFSWRSRGRWSTLTAFRLADGGSFWETVEVAPARLQLRRRGVTGDRARLSRLADTLAELDGVEACHVTPWFHRITIDVNRDSPLSDQFLDTVEHTLVDIRSSELPHSELRIDAREAISGGDVAVADAGWKRLGYLAMAGGAFAMTLVALVVPGIPTVPCLLATSYYLVRSSPRLNERLRHAPFFGPILREWEHEGALSRFSKEKLTGLTLVIVGATVMLVVLTPVALVLIVLISSLSIYGIARMPDLPEGSDGSPRLNGIAFRALPAP